MADGASIYRGDFWLPSEPKKQQAGTLVVEADGSARLELVHAFPTVRWVPIEGSDAHEGHAIDGWPVIHGSSGDYGFTLIDCETMSYRGLDPDNATDHVLAIGRTLRGPMLLDDGSDVAITGMLLELDYAVPWSAMTAMTMSVETRNDDTDSLSYIQKTSARPTVKAVVGGLHFTLQMQVSAKAPVLQNPNSRVMSAAEQVFIYVERRTRKPLSYWDEVEKKLQDLLTLCANTPCAVRSVTYTVPLPRSRSKAGKRITQRYGSWNTQSFQRQIFGIDSRPLNTRYGQFLMTLKDVPFEELIPAWFALYDELRVPIQIFLAQQYVSETYIGTQLGAVSSAVEALHAGMCPEELMPEHKFDQIVAEALDGISSDFNKTFIEQRLSNRVGYNRRATDVAKLLGKPIRNSLLGNIGTWALLLTRARNDIAHANGPGAIGPVLQHRLLLVTQILLKLVLASKLGLSTDNQKRFLNQNQLAMIASSDFRKLSAEWDKAQAAAKKAK